MIILAIDAATNLGWAHGEPGGKPDYGSVDLAVHGRSDATIGWRAVEWLRDLLPELRPALVVYESPLDPRWKGAKTSRATGRRLLGLPFLIEACCYGFGVRDIREASARDVAKHFLGTTTFPGRTTAERREAKKAATIRQCRLLGWRPQDDDAADSLALWEMQCALVRRDLALRSTPLGLAA